MSVKSNNTNIEFVYTLLFSIFSDNEFLFYFTKYSSMKDVKEKTPTSLS